MLKRIVTAINAADETTSKILNVKNAKSLMAVFTRTNHSAGSSTFKIEGSVDEVTFFSLPLLALVANSNAQTLKRDMTVALASNTSEARAVEPIFLSMLKQIKVTATEGTDGNHTAKLAIEDELNS